MTLAKVNDLPYVLDFNYSKLLSKKESFLISRKECPKAEAHSSIQRLRKKVKHVWTPNLHSTEHHPHFISIYFSRTVPKTCSPIWHLYLSSTIKMLNHQTKIQWSSSLSDAGCVKKDVPRVQQQWTSTSN